MHARFLMARSHMTNTRWWTRWSTIRIRSIWCPTPNWGRRLCRLPMTHHWSNTRNSRRHTRLSRSASHRRASRMMFWGTFGSVTHARGTRVSRHTLLGYCSLFLSPRGSGRVFRWFSSRGCLQYMAKIASMWWLIDWQSLCTSLPFR